MKAAQALAKSKTNAETIRIKEAKEAKEKAIKAKAASLKAHKTFYHNLVKETYESIASAVKYGRKSCYDTIYSGSRFGTELWFHFPDKHPYCKEYKLLMRRLRRDGYRVEVNYTAREIDDTGAYLNSDGECGSKEPYWVDEIRLEVSWE